MSHPPFRLYDTMTRRIREIVPVEPNHLRFYACGPTVYSYATIGNFRTFLNADLVYRTALAIGWRVSYVSNITDVGHLTQDDLADADGEDKLEKALQSKEGQAFSSIWDLAQHYADGFVQDWRLLNLLEPTVRPRATQHMREQIVAIQKLVADGHAYETPSGVYFDVESFPEYGKLSGNLDQDNLIRGVREVVTDENKRHPADFALWKKDEKHLMQWFSPWGWGFPGWHIECSAMAMRYLGATLDLHIGGEDLVFPHHECEIAQSESLTGQTFSNHWMHVRFLMVDGEKMSKSKGNYYTVRDLVLEKGVDPLALRYALISVPYNKPHNFTMQTLRDAAGNVERFAEAGRRIDAVLGSDPIENTPTDLFRDLYTEAVEAMCDDLNTSVALSKLVEGAKAILREGTPSRDTAMSGAWFLDKMNALLGVVENGYEMAAPTPESNDSDARIEELVRQRAEAKKAKDFAKADSIRAELLAEGIELRDSPEGTTWVRKNLLF